MEEDIKNTQLLNQKLALFCISLFSTLNAVSGFASQTTATETFAIVASSSSANVLHFCYFTPTINTSISPRTESLKSPERCTDFTHRPLGTRKRSLVPLETVLRAREAIDLF